VISQPRPISPNGISHALCSYWRLNCTHSRNAIERKHEEKERRKRAKELAAARFLKGPCGSKYNASFFAPIVRQKFFTR